ncbi:acylphosphatase-2 isoform X1 [Alligator mississippiensis]|uniref:acylphosphatase-2 isoform X1 n=1 Tax=Alligator mississippiensis TaxID=8496 RepID=UPI002877C737|nr:acylphosphatase-2 isoform X1 [Alligator mississippiensis]
MGGTGGASPCGAPRCPGSLSGGSPLSLRSGGGAGTAATARYSNRRTDTGGCGGSDNPPPPPPWRPPGSGLSTTRSTGMCRYTEEQGRKLGLAGWVRNTPRGTVTGQVQGPKDKVEIMRNWLRSVGSPMSRIDRAVFSNEREVRALEFTGFSTKY